MLATASSAVDAVSDLRKMVLGCIELGATKLGLSSDLYQLAKTHLAG
jgi:hypothetical protein